MRLLFAAASLGSLVPAHRASMWSTHWAFVGRVAIAVLFQDGGRGHWRQGSDTADFEGLAAFGSVDLPAFLEPQPF